MSEPAKLLEFPDSQTPPESPPPKGFLYDLKTNIQFRKKFIASMAMLTVLSLVATLSYKWFIYAASHIETNNAYIEGDIYHVQSRMMGFTKELKVVEGSVVHKGDLILTLDDTDILVEKGYKEAKLKKASADFHRAEKLLELKMVSQSDFEALEAGNIAAQADANGTDLKLKYTQVIAPADGVIAKSYVRPGQFIQPGQNLFTLVSDQNLWIKANYKETQIEKIHKGQTVLVEVDAFPDVRMKGTVEDIYPSSGAVVSLFPPENATGNFTKVVQRVPVKIKLVDTQKRALRPGMSVNTTVVVAGQE